jgi:hypothetical protein
MADLTQEIRIDLIPNFPLVKVTRPIQDNVCCYQGTWLTEDGSNNVGPRADGEKVAGLCEQSVDNTGVGHAAALASKSVQVIKGGPIKWYISGTTGANIGDNAYLSTDNHTLSTTWREKCYVGKIIANDGAGLCDIMLDELTMGENNDGSFDTTLIVVSKGGSDTDGVGSFMKPYLTVTKAITMWTAARNTILIQAGEYAEAAMLTWPSITGLSMVGVGEVTISNANAAAQVLNISPTYTASTFEATIQNITFEADTQIGIEIANAGMTKKLNVYLTDVSCEFDTSGDSLSIDGTVSGQAIRVYVDGGDFEGLVHFTANDAASRLRCMGTRFTGGIDTTGAVAAELSLMGCVVLTGGLAAMDAAWNFSCSGCLYATNADPAVYTELANAYSA